MDTDTALNSAKMSGVAIQVMTKLLSVFSLMWDDRYPATHITDTAKTPESKTGCFRKQNETSVLSQV